jgi:hypothetical protein
VKISTARDGGTLYHQDALLRTGRQTFVDRYLVFAVYRTRIENLVASGVSDVCE